MRWVSLQTSSRTLVRIESYAPFSWPSLHTRSVWGSLLAALADSTRDEVALRLRIETSRASVRSGVRTVLVFSVAFAVGLAVLAHPYLSPFDSADGQIVLAVVGALYAAALTLMVYLARPPAPVRLLGRQV